MRTFSDDLLSNLRRQGDPLADAVVQAWLLDAPQAIRAGIERLRQPSPPADLSEVERAFVIQTSQLPTWADARKLQRAATLFQRHTPEIMTMLGLLSLPYCYAAADGAQVLRLSERLTNDATKRLQETAQFVWQVLQPHSFESDGPGWSSVRQVRLVHALVRHHAAKHPHWNHAWGLPVNQEDQAGTNLAFSLVVLRGLRRMHLLISPEEAEAFLHRWRVIGFLLGIDPLVLPATLQEAYYLDRAIVRRHFRESDAGKALTKALLHSLHEQAPAFRLAPYYMRFLLGDDVADLLELPRDATQQFLLEPLRVANAFRSATGSAFGQPPLPVQFKNYFAFPIPTWPVAS